MNEPSDNPFLARLMGIGESAPPEVPGGGGGYAFRGAGILTSGQGATRIAGPPRIGRSVAARRSLSRNLGS